MRLTVKVLAVLCAAAASVAVAEEETVRSRRAIAWHGPSDTWQMKEHLKRLEAVTNGGANVVFLGDSITQFWTNRDRGLPVWNRHYAEGDCKALNLGFCGDLTQNVIWRITEGGELDGFKAKCIVLMIGTNNSSRYQFNDEPVVDMILGIRRILEIVVEKQPQATVVLHPIFPRQRDDSPKSVFRRRNDAVNKEIQKFADGRRIFWCDFNEQLLTADGVLSPEIAPDQLHPGRLGYEIWHAAVRPYIDFALSDGKLPQPVNRYASHIPGELYQSVRGSYELPVSRIGFGLDDPWLNRVLDHRRAAWASRQASANGWGAVDVVFFGDDQMAGLETVGAEALAELRKAYSVFAFGCSGDRLVNQWWRATHGELDGFKAKCVVFQVPMHESGDAEAFAKGFSDLTGKVINRQLDAKILLLPPFPCGASSEDRRRRELSALGTAARNKVVDGKRVRFVDFNARLVDAKGDTKAFMDDRLHLNAAGYREVFLPALAPHLKEIVGR